jgi:radical SAM protein with 4Fe4S-binding SPASM domain
MKCNQSCSFCSNENKIIPDLSYERALRLLAIASNHAIEEIDIMGGEPLLLPWMPDFIARAIDKGLNINISTNGSKPEAIGRFKGTGHNKLNIGVSLEGSNEERHNRLTNSSHFRHAVKSIRNLIALDLNPIVKTVISKSSISDIQDIIGLIREMGVSRYYIIHMDLMSADNKSSKESLSYNDFISVHEHLKYANPDMGVFKVHASCFSRYSIPEGTRCAGGVLKLSVLPDGEVFPCSLLHRFDRFSLGNIFDNDLMSIWMDQKLDYFRTFTKNSCQIEDCSNRHLCSGGCPAHGYYHHNNPDVTDIRCSL